MATMDREQDRVAAGWNEDSTFRWIEAGRLRVEEDDKGATLLARLAAPGVSPDGFPIELYGPTWLSATELAGLARQLVGWFIEDPAETIQQIEATVARVKTELEAWDDRARIDEEHPPYEKLVAALDDVVRTCRRFREEGPFAACSEVPR